MEAGGSQLTVVLPYEDEVIRKFVGAVNCVGDEAIALPEFPT